MRLSELASHLGVELVGGDCDFTTVSIDSRTLQPGDLFVAIKGANFDGHDYLQAALAAGASACISEQPLTASRPYLLVEDSVLALGRMGQLARKQFQGAVLAVTGSCGKTTVKGMLREIFASQGSVIATKGNLNNQIGVPLTLMQLQQQKVAVIELGTNSPGEIGYLAELIQPDVALVTNVAAVHIGQFADLDAIAEEKSQVYAPLKAAQVAVINGDDAYAARFLQKTQACKQLVFTTSDAQPSLIDAHLQAREISIQDGFPSFTLHYRAAVVPIKLQVLGRHNVSNAAAAAACALAAGASADAVRQGLERFDGEKGRMRGHQLPGFTLIDDSYNANPKAVKAAVDFLAEQGGAATYLVLGNMGELGSYCKQAHEEVGQYARERQVTGIYTIGKDAALAAKAFGAGGRAFDTKAELVDSIAPCLRDNATVLVKGSRSARMEDVVDALRAAGATAC